MWTDLDRGVHAGRLKDLMKVFMKNDGRKFPMQELKGAELATESLYRL